MVYLGLMQQTRVLSLAWKVMPGQEQWEIVGQLFERVAQALGAADCMVLADRGRMRVEATFQGMKRWGWQWESTLFVNQQYRLLYRFNCSGTITKEDKTENSPRPCLVVLVMKYVHMPRGEGTDRPIGWMVRSERGRRYISIIHAVDATNGLVAGDTDFVEAGAAIDRAIILG